MANFNNLNIKTFTRGWLTVWMILIAMLGLNTGQIYSQCNATVGSNLVFDPGEVNQDANYSILYIMTDYDGLILGTSPTNSIVVNEVGLFKIFRIDYLTNQGVQNALVNNNIKDVTCSCLAIPSPLEILVCPSEPVACNTFNNVFTFSSIDGNTSLSTAYVLTTLDQSIIQISTTPSFSNFGTGMFLIFPVNFSDIDGLNIGANLHNISGTCFEVGSPIFFKSCQNCSVTIGQNIELCESQPLLLTATASHLGSFDWSTGQSGTSILTTPIQSIQSYSVTFTNAEGCVATATIDVSIIGNPISDAGIDRTICEGQITTLTATHVPGAQYFWSTGATTQSISVSPTITQSYTLTVLLGDCYAVSGVTVFVTNLPDVSISGNSAVCSGSTTTLTASGGMTYVWSNGESTASISIHPMSTTSYTVTVTNNGGCTASESIEISVSTCDLCEIYDCNIDCNRCQGDITFNSEDDNESLTTVFALVNVYGSIIQLSSIHVFTNVNEGTYFIFGINYDELRPISGLTLGGNINDVSGECLDIGDPLVIQVCSKPVAQIIGPNEICLESSAALVANGGTTYLWSNGATTSSITVTPLITTTYSVTVTNAIGCTTIVEKTLNVKSCGSIGDFVWDDLNANGIQDLGEPGIPNALVRLFNQAGVQVAFRVTNPLGHYEFNNLPEGTYYLKFDIPPGYVPTINNTEGDPNLNSDADPITGLTPSVSLMANETITSLDAGFFRYARIGDFVWEDFNSNGIQDDLEPGISGVLVGLTGVDATGNNVALTTTTNAVGFYQFSNLVPGNYMVTFSRPNDQYKSSPVNATGDTARDSDADPISGSTPVTTVISGQNKNSLDAGFFRCSQVGDLVWLDQGGVPDIQDAGDIGLNGVLVELYSTLIPTIPDQVMMTTTNPFDPIQNGYYSFEVCKIGTYFIKVRKGILYDFVTPNQGQDDAVDSDIIDFENESTLAFTVNYAVTITDIDAGLKFKALPVRFKEFTGWWNQILNLNELNWITLSEVNNDHFILERSVNGAAFEFLAKIEGSGNSTNEITYSFDDVDIDVNGVYVYRLTQYDFDGRFNSTKPVEIFVNRKGQAKTNIWPNPSSGAVNVEIFSNDGNIVQADLYDGTGKLVSKSFINLRSNGYGLYSRIEGERLDRGIYCIKISIDGYLVSTHKLLIIE